MTHKRRQSANGSTPRPGRWFGLALLLWLCGVALGARAADLSAVGDGEHLWLVVEDPEPAKRDQPRLLIYHLPDDAERGQMAGLEPLAGALMARGLAAGEGELLIVRKDRSVALIRPAMSPLLQRWVYETGSLPRLPDGCALVSIAIGARGPWALVRVESAKTLEQLDRAGARPEATDEDLTELKRVLGLPEDFDFEPGAGPPGPSGKQPTPATDGGNDTAGDVESGEPSGEDAPPGPAIDGIDFNGEDTESRWVVPGHAFTLAQRGTDALDGEPTPGDAAEVGAAAVPDAVADDREGDRALSPPVYRLITTRGGRWVSSPLPADFAAPKHAELVVRVGDDRPTILTQVNADGATPGQLLRYTPAAVASDAPSGGPGDTASASPDRAWSGQVVKVQPTPLGPWTAVPIDRQLAVIVERSRSDQSVAVEAFVLRGDKATPLRRLTLPTDGPARWSAVAWGSGLALVARPGPELEAVETERGDAPAIEALAGMIALNVMSREIVRADEDDTGVVVLYEGEPTALQGNADLLIQIGAFVVAMLMMMLFYRRAPRGDQLDLPDRVVLAGYGRRAIAGLIDLMPGFWLAGVLYDTTFSETILYWPGNGVAKVIPAMRPGFVVIAVTVAHTTLFEFVFARSIGKWFTGLRVADLAGKPAPPGPAFVRAVSRVFDLFAPLMLVLVVISPARQRLGDILAKTIVVTHEPEEEQKQAEEDEL
ncbi:MAG: RDD family protein [Phycisphaeraceae bacterium]